MFSRLRIACSPRSRDVKGGEARLPTAPAREPTPGELGNNWATVAGLVEKLVAEGRFELLTKGL